MLKRLFVVAVDNICERIMHEIDASIATCASLKGLLYKYDEYGWKYDDEVLHYTDLGKLAEALREEESPVVVLSALAADDRLPQSALEIAQFVLRNTQVRSVVTATRGYVIGNSSRFYFSAFQITQTGIEVMVREEIFHDHFYHRLLLFGRVVYDRVVREIAKKAA